MHVRILSHKSVVTALVLFTQILGASVVSSYAADVPARTWAGNWNNAKYKTSGPLKCSATLKDDTTWDAKFTGEGLGKPFDYPATIKISKKGNRLILQGTTSVDGEAYRWSGYVEGKYLVGSYRSTSGNNGTFRLQESK